MAVAIVVAATGPMSPARSAPPLSGAASLGIGGRVACAGAAAGGVHCWGNGPLGRTTSGRAAGPVEALSGVFTVLDANSQRACGRTTTGAVWCWGDIYGFGAKPYVVPTLSSGVADLALGDGHQCVATTAGGARCWGSNAYGELGHSGPPDVPNDVTGLGAGSGVTRVTAGRSFSCATLASGARCWGFNGNGELGNGTTSNSPVPVAVQGLGGSVLSLAAGISHACAVIGGGAKCWGANSAGQLGDGTFATRSSPVDVVGATSGIAAVAAGGSHSCALRTDGAVVCWGSNSAGQLGDGTLTQRLVAAPVVGLGGPAVAIAAGEEFTCALRSDGVVRCFGDNWAGSLGVNAVDARLFATPVGQGPWSRPDLGALNGCAIGNGAAFCWGNNAVGQVGDGSTIGRSEPVPVTGLASGTASLAVGYSHACAVRADTTLWCWGSNDSGQLGATPSYTPHPVPAPVPGLAGVSGATAGAQFTCALADEGAWCWGRNEQGQLGDGTTQLRATPQAVAGFAAGVREVAAGEGHACAVTTAGAARCWGANGSGQLGDGTRISRPAPIPVLGLGQGVLAIATGSRHSCALLVGGEVRCWGENGDGQLGTPASASVPVPVTVPGLPGAAVDLAAGERHSCALDALGTVRCWGGTSGSVPAPEVGPDRGPGPVVVNLPGPASEIAAGVRSSCARLADSRLYCWGVTEEGRLGTGDARLSTLPRTVVTGDFSVALAAVTTPNPSLPRDLVRLDVQATGVDLLPAGTVTVRRRGETLCSGWLQYGAVACDLVLTPGTHPLEASYASNDGHLPATTTHVHVVGTQAGEPCSGFDDVDAADPLCASVDWMRNRAITQGCSAFRYCPADAVSRLAMAAFLQRAGVVLAPTVLSREQVGYLPLNYTACSTYLPAAPYPRRALVDIVVTGMNQQAPIDLDVTAVVLLQGFETPSAPTRVTAATQVHVNARARTHVDIPTSVAAEFAARVTPVTAAPVYQLDGGSCALRAIVVNRTESFAPFDKAMP